MADLAALRELCKWMREEKILYARCGELELRLEPAPAPAAKPFVPLADTVEDDEADRRDLETLLYSSGAEVEPFLRVMRGQKGDAA